MSLTPHTYKQTKRARNIVSAASRVTITLGFVWLFGGYYFAGFITNPVDPTVELFNRESLVYQTQLAEYEAKIGELNSIKVYRTRTGKRYHRPYHYGTRNSPIGLGSAIRRGLTSCGVCNPGWARLPDRPTQPEKKPAPTEFVVMRLAILAAGLVGLYFLADRLHRTETSLIETVKELERRRHPMFRGD